MRHALGTLASLWLALACGCDEVGAPLVDRLPRATPDPPTVDCTQPPSCEPPEPPEDERPRQPATALDLSTCGAAKARSCALRETAGDVEVGTDDPDADAGAPLGEQVTSCSPALDDGAVECEALDVLAEGGEHIVSGLTLRSVNLSIRATRPTSLTLDEASLEVVFVAMQGPITLRVLRAQLLERLRVVGTPGAEGEPRLELLDVDGKGVQAGDAEAAFEGTLRFDRVALQDAELVAAQLELRSVALEAGRIEARTLTAADLQTSHTTLAVGDGLLSAFTLFDTTIERCGALALVAGRTLRSSLAACSGPPVRVYDTILVDGRADGRIESDGTTWERVAFGVSGETRLTVFGGVLRSVNFCAGAEHTMFGDGASISCSKCDGWSEPSHLPCQLEQDEELVQYSNFCALLDPSTFAVCPAPVPERERPLDLPF